MNLYKIKRNILMISFFLLLNGCVNENKPFDGSPNQNNNGKESLTSEESQQLFSIEINQQFFEVTVFNNDATQELMKHIPFTVQMDGLNKNEKHYTLDYSLYSNNMIQPSMIYEGEIMCYSNHTLVLFDETFSNNYNGYIKLGKVKDIDTFTKLLRNNDIVEVTFHLNKNIMK